MIRAALIAATLAAQPLQEPGPNRYDVVCDGREATKAELFDHRVRELQEWRRDMGMPSSRRHIVALLRSKAAHGAARSSTPASTARSRRASTAT